MRIINGRKKRNSKRKIKYRTFNVKRNILEFAHNCLGLSKN
jgi:hypothetical protein